MHADLQTLDYRYRRLYIDTALGRPTEYNCIKLYLYNNNNNIESMSPKQTNYTESSRLSLALSCAPVRSVRASA